MLPGLHCGMLFAGVAATAALNPSDKSANATLSNSDFTVTMSGIGSVRSILGTDGVNKKWYVEFTINNVSNAGPGAGTLAGSISSSPGAGANGSIGLNSLGNVQVNGSVQGTGIGSWTTGDTIGMRVDDTTGLVSFNKNNGAFGTAYAPSTVGTPLYIKCGGASPAQLTVRATPLYSLPSGYTYWGT